MNEINEYIAYKGSSFTIEWFFNAKDQSQALDYYNSLTVVEHIKVLKLFKRMGDAGEIFDKTKFRHEGNKVYVFKPQPERFLCFFYENQKIIITNGFRKKQQKLPASEKMKCIQIRNDYISRVKSGEYYGEETTINI